MHEGIKSGVDARKLTDEQKKAIEQVIKNSPAVAANEKTKKPLGHRMGEIFASMLVACVSALIIALTLKLISMILF